jgi:membrane-bound lytic murein transglycosylase D
MFRLFSTYKRVKTFTVRTLVLITMTVGAVSCYVTKPSGYYGPDTLPRKETSITRRVSSKRPSLYEVSKLPAIDLKLNHEIAEEVRNYSSQGKLFRESFERREPYYEVLKQIFRDEKVPVELLSLALVESSFKINARSPMGAVGLWQFIKGTAREYGLNVGILNDERKDPVLSTIAAARMLRDLYTNYEDWNLVLAAYNAGPAAVDRALRETKAKTFWDLSRMGRLNPETRRFVPKVLAAAIIERDKIFG